MTTSPEVTIEFCCPRCGSSWFNSNRHTYYCSGDGHRSCRFEFPFEDMWKHSVLVTRVKFETREDYDKAKQK